MYDFINIYRQPSESYARQLDRTVQLQERPYGYEMPPPPADSGDYDMRSKESKKQYHQGHFYG